MYGDLASITPPITVPAWACAMTGKTPGQLGIYGFRNRKDTTYDGLSIATSRSVKEPAVWDALGAAGKRSLLIGVPPASRRPRSSRAGASACFLTPPSAEPVRVPGRARDRDRGGARRGRVHLRHPELPPAGLRLRAGPDLQDDRAAVPGGAAPDQEQALGLLHDGARSAWTGCTTASGSSTTRRTRSTRPGNKYETAFHDYYRFLDQEIGTLLEVLPEDVVTIVMSDHGARPMMGGLCFNDWLIQEGYLVLKEPVREITPIKEADDRLEPHGRVGRRRLLRAAAS